VKRVGHYGDPDTPPTLATIEDGVDTLVNIDHSVGTQGSR
jgi:hypothetical protein